MRRDVVLALFLATTSGLFAALGAYNWMPMGQTKKPVVQAPPQIELTTVLVAKKDLVFGASLNADELQESKWPADTVPDGSYKTVAEFFGEQQNRVVLEGLRANEPILRGKVSGPGQRATLSNMIGTGKKAVAVKVDEVLGVGGFVLPGDYVDLLLVVEEREDDDRKKPKLPGYTDLLVERVRVLAVDQNSDLKLETPKLVQTVTLEVEIDEAQKIALAGTLGRISLVLRSNALAADAKRPKRLSSTDLSGDSGDKASFQPTIAVAPEPETVAPSVREEEEPAPPPVAKINIVRSTESSEYSVTRVKPKG